MVMKESGFFELKTLPQHFLVFLLCGRNGSR